MEDCTKLLNKNSFLIAEDNDLNWKIISCLLAKYGISTIRAINGKECVEIITANPQAYDLILMDLNMPIVNGIQATRMIRSSDEECVKNIPIIAMTADNFEEDIEETKKAGMNGYALKPINMATLFQVIKDVLS